MTGDFFPEGPPQEIKRKLESAYKNLLEAIDAGSEAQRNKNLKRALNFIRKLAERCDNNTEPLEQAFIAAAESGDILRAVHQCCAFCYSFHRDKTTLPRADYMADILLAQVRRDSKLEFLALSRPEFEELLQRHGVTVDAETFGEMWKNHQTPGIGQRFALSDAIEELADCCPECDGPEDEAFEALERARGRARKPTENTKRARRLYGHK